MSPVLRVPGCVGRLYRGVKGGGDGGGQVGHVPPSSPGQLAAVSEIMGYSFSFTLSCEPVQHHGDKGLFLGLQGRLGLGHRLGRVEDDARHAEDEEEVEDQVKYQDSSAGIPERGK